MINPKVRAIDRIHQNLQPDLKQLMKKHILSEEEHLRVLENIKEESYTGKNPVKKPKFIIVAGQTGSGKSNLTASIYKKDEGNIVIIDSDRYKAYKADSKEILRNHLVEYAFLTAPDAYLHRDEMIVDAMKKRYNILMECAPSQKEGLFVDVSQLMDAGYNVEINVLGVSSLNSLLSIHERYEAKIKLNDISAKLTGIERHDDSFKALGNIIKDAQKLSGITINVFERGRTYPYVPKEIYFSNSNERIFSCPFEALMCTQHKDGKLAIQNFENRYKTVKCQMDERNAPEAQKEQLEKVWERYEKLREQEMEY